MIDPYATLGLPAGAGLDEVKRAYRALAKRYHPDSAGEAATVRFLAIQAAYEALTDPSNGATARSGAPAGPSRPSSPDPARARATREAYRTRRTSSTGQAGAAGTAGAGGSGGATGAPPRSSASERPWPPGSGTGSAGANGATDPQARRRGPRKASLGSTSYDDALEWEPEWSGGTWYGTTSGTHWTVNPKEYADPRKHGPEYLARARRRVEWANERARTTDEAPEPDPEAEAAEDAPAADVRARPGPATATPPPRPAFTTFAASGADGSSVGSGGTGALRLGTTIPARLIAALLAWPPIGLLVALAIGEVSGCARYSAACSEDASLATWAVQPLIVAALLLVPAIARPAAVGSIALLVAAVPAAAAFSAGAGNRGPSRETVGLFVAILIMAYAVAFVGAATDRIPLPSWLRPRDAD